MKNNQLYNLILLFIGGVLFLLPNYYHNTWTTVEPNHYEDWQIHYDRTVIARVVKTRQDGMLSAGGLLGLGNVDAWSYNNSVNQDQYNTFVNNNVFFSYLPYKSHPGFQGIIFGFIDQIDSIPKDQALKIFRGLTALASAIVIAIIIVGVGLEISWISALLLLFFSAFCKWMILPAGSIYWNLWAFFLPFVTCALLLAFHTKSNKYSVKLITWGVFATTLIKILFTGFELITVVLIMTTVPILFYAISNNWQWKTFFNYFARTGIALSAATITGLFVLSMQLIINDGNWTSFTNQVIDRFGMYFFGNTDYFFDPTVQATKISAVEITSKYLLMPAINVKLPGPDTQILYWHLVVLFAIVTFIYLFSNKKQEKYPQQAVAVIATTWYSILAPLSWYLLFRPHSILHTHVNTMAWQMPFTLLGFALCGFVITDLFRKISA